jgi:hypothetical protein
MPLQSLRIIPLGVFVMRKFRELLKWELSTGTFGSFVNLFSVFNWELSTVIFWKFRELIFSRMVSSGMLRRVALVRNNVSEELSAAFIRVTRIGELGKT